MAQNQIDNDREDKNKTETRIMPPASMVDNSFMSMDPFSQFGQLSLDHQHPQAENNPAAPAPETPPQAAKTNHMVMTNEAPGMNTGYQQYGQQQQQQPMQISPEQPTTAGSLVQQQAACANYQYNSFGQQPNAQMQMQQQQQMQMQTNNGGFPAQSALSPPISPLWNPASPGQTPPDGTQGSGMQANGMMPSLPTGFGNAPPSQGGVPVPTLSPGSPAANPFDMYAPPAAAPSVAAAPAAPFAGNSAVSQGQPAPAQEQNQQDDADFWNDMGFGSAAPSDQNNQDASPGNVTPTPSLDSGESFSSITSGDNSGAYQDHSLDDTPVTLDERGLPAGGDYYNARVTTTMLGAIFSSCKELRSTLFKTASNSFVESIGDRPVISFTIDGSAADTAGIGLGHVLLKVNGEDVTHTDEAVMMVGAAKRPMIMEFYIPNKDVKVVKTEGQCMVKYDNHSTEAPASQIEWKPKYVVVGDMLGKPHILYMYRSKVSIVDCLTELFGMYFPSLRQLANEHVHLLPSPGRV